MNFYEELNAKFSTATQHFKAGNHVLFFRDMTHWLSDLLFTKGKYTVSQKNSQNCFWHNSVKFLPTLIIFGTKWPRRYYYVLCTVWNADAPNCYIMRQSFVWWLTFASSIRQMVQRGLIILRY